MTYKKGQHCNNGCRYHYIDIQTVYNPSHHGDPGSTDYDVEKLYCCVNCDDDCIPLDKIKYNCPYWSPE